MRHDIRSIIRLASVGDLPEAYVRFIERTFREAWAEYDAAGRPFGDADEALAIWVEFGREARRN
jgi:hypothetical protein